MCNMKTFNSYRCVMLVIIGILYFFVCLHRLSPTVIARDLAQTFNADAVILGIIGSAYFYLYSAMQPLVGYLSDIAGPRKVMSFLFFISALGALIFGLAPNPPIAILGRAFIGAGVAGIFIPALKIFSRWYRTNQFTSLTGIMSTINGLGGISAAMPLTYLVVLFGWRGSFVAIGLISIALASCTWIIVRDRPEDRGWLAVNGEESTSYITSGKISILRRCTDVFKNPDFCLVCLVVFLFWGGNTTFQGLWAVPYLMDVFGLDKVWAGWVLMAWPLGFAIGGPLIGILTDRLVLNHKRVYLWGLGVNIVLWFIMIFLSNREYLMVVALFFFIFGLIAGGTLPVAFTITRDLFPFQIMGTATGLMNTAGFFGIAVYMPFTGFLLKTASTNPDSYTINAYRTILIAFLLSSTVAFLATSLLSNRETSLGHSDLKKNAP